MNILHKLNHLVTRYGVAGTMQKVEQKLRKKTAPQHPLFTEEELEHQKCVTFPNEVTFSILVPLYNTPEKFLREMIESVTAQTYAKWQLCLADGSDAQHEDVERICREYMVKDERICYEKLEQNLGISGNTNACIDLATGEYIALFDHDDLLHPSALYEMMMAVCRQQADFIYTDEDLFRETPEDAYCPNYKPDFAPDTLRSYNYICHFTAFSRELLDQVGGFRSEFDGSQDYDMILRLTEKAQHIVHIPEVLYYWRNHADSTASDVAAKPYTMTAAKKALTEHLQRVGLKGEVTDAAAPTTYRIKYDIVGNPLVSIIMYKPEGDENVQRCRKSIEVETLYQNYEVIQAEDIDSGVRQAKGEYLLLLDGNTEIISPGWLTELLMYAQRADVGAVGGMLYYTDDTVEHAGVILGVGGTAGMAHQHYPRNSDGYKFRMELVQNYSAVTSACMMVRRTVWEEAHGMDGQFGPFLNGVDFCLRLRELGYLNVWTPYVELYHHIAYRKTIGTEEKNAFRERWEKVLAHADPYYNPNLNLRWGDFTEKE